MNQTDFVVPGLPGLAEAVIRQAVSDYRAAIRLKAVYGGHAGEAQIVELENFFRSQWFGVLCQIEPETMIELLHREARKKYGTNHPWW